jgi:hypothetical protein
MHLLALFLTLAAVILADDAPTGGRFEIRPSGNMYWVETFKTSTPTSDATPVYMSCNANKAQPLVCDAKTLTKPDCLSVCHLRGKDKSYKINCDDWNKCHGADVLKACRCDFGFWFRENWPNLPPEQKEPKIEGKLKALEK